MRAPITWGHLKSWAVQNELPDGATIRDERDRTVQDFGFTDGDFSVVFIYQARRRVTWEDMQAWAGQHAVPDDARLHVFSGNVSAVLDLGHREEELGEDYLILRTTSG